MPRDYTLYLGLSHRWLSLRVTACEIFFKFLQRRFDKNVSHRLASIAECETLSERE